MRYTKYFITVITILLPTLGLWSLGIQPALAQGGIIGRLQDVLKKTEGSGEEGGKEPAIEDKKAGEEYADKQVPEEEFDIPDPLEWKPDFIDVGDEEDWKQLGSTTDEDGNTTTVYKTKDGVWIKETRDKDGNLIRVERKKELPDGGKKVEIIDYKTSKRTQEVYDWKGNLVSSLTIDEKKGERKRAIYKGGIIVGSKSIDSQGNITRTTYDNKGRVQYSDTKDKDGNVKKTIDHEVKENGMVVVRVIDHEKGTTTKSTTAPDGSTMFRTEDNKTGETLHEAAVTADGRILEYKTGPDADKAFEGGEVISQSALDEKLKEQMAGGVAVGGEGVIVSGHFTERTAATQKEGPEGTAYTHTERVTVDSEARSIDPDGPYAVKSVGEAVSADGYGKTPSEALRNALSSAAGNVTTKIKSEFLDHTRSTQKTKAGELSDWSAEEEVSQDIETSSFVVFEGYEVESIGMEDGNYVVKVKAKPGVTVRK